jgi:hypothetical protein
MKTKQQEWRRAWYLKNKRRVLDSNNERRKKMREYIKDVKNVPCADCGVQYPPHVMDFDHLDKATKVDIPSRIVNSLSMKKLVTEIAKCEVVCSNCHRQRTFDRITAK